jgi:protein TonB
MNLTIMTSPNLLSQRKGLDIFACMIVISLLLHASLSLVMLLPARGYAPEHPPLFVDLSSMAAAPASEPLAEPSPDEPAESVPVEPAPPVEPPPPTAAETLQNTVAATREQAAVQPEAVHQTAIGLGMTSGYFGSFAEGATLKDDIREYYFALMRRINEVWWTRSGASAFGKGASFVLFISRDGKVIDCRLLQSSGNRNQDTQLMEAVRLAEPLPPLPASYPDFVFNAPIRFVPPLQLMIPGLKPSLTPPPHG